MLGYFDLPAEGKREVEVIADIEQGELLELKPYDTNYDDEGKALWGRRRRYLCRARDRDRMDRCRRPARRELAAAECRALVR